MNNLFTRILLAILCIVELLCITACGKQAEVGTVPTNQAGENSPLSTDISGQNLTPTPLTKPIARRILTPRPKPSPTPTPTPTPTLTPTPSPTPTPTPPLNPLLSYLEISVNKEDIVVYISKDPMKPEVLVGKAGGKFHSFSWDYNLDYGTPVIDIDNRKELLEKFGFSDQEELLMIWLPTEPLAEQHFPSYFDKPGTICGEGHCLSVTALSDPNLNVIQDILLDASAYAEKVGKFTVGYAKDEDGEEQLSLFSAQGDILKQYPMLCLPKGNYPVIYETPHISSAGWVYQRFGIAVDEVNLWLGQQTNNFLFLSREEGMGYDARYSPYLQKWWPREIGEENHEILLDLDGNGSPERIVWHIEEKGQEKETRVTINGMDYPLLCPEWGNITPVFTISLDGKTNQLVVIDYAYGVMENFIVFGYRDGKIYEVGKFCNMEYWKKKAKEKNIYVSHALCYPLQHAQVWVEQEFVDGVLREIPQDYYEFVEDATTWKRTIFKAKKTISLYQEKGKEATVLLMEGSPVRMIGTDLKEWVLLENPDTSERGWLRVPMKERDGGSCILPDGTRVNGSEIFEGLADAG